MNTWRLICDGYRTGAENMARDEALALCAALSRFPTLRAYRFRPPAVTLGRFQPVSDRAEFERAKALGMDLVRRPTGGLAIPHRNDFTYSVVMSIKRSRDAVRERVFRLVASCIVEALRHLGIAAVLAEHPRTNDHSEDWCFESAYGVDLVWSGRKICGSAQRVFKDSILQHGSLFLESAKPPGDSQGSLVALNEAGNREYVWEEVLRAFVKGFETTLEAELVPGEMTAAEEDLAEKLVRDKYDTSDWLMLDGPSRRVHGL